MHYAAVISTLGLVLVTSEITHVTSSRVVVGDPASRSALAARDADAFRAVAVFRKFGTNSARLEVAAAQAAGRIMLLPNGTPARLLDAKNEPGAVRVELEGPFNGTVVYIAAEHALR